MPRVRKMRVINSSHLSQRRDEFRQVLDTRPLLIDPLERSNRCPTAVATIRSTESVSVAPRVDCSTTKVAIAAQYASGIFTSRAITTDAVAATAVRIAWV